MIKKILISMLAAFVAYFVVGFSLDNFTEMRGDSIESAAALVGIIVFMISMNKVKRGQSGIDIVSGAFDSVNSIQNNIDLKSANFYAVAEEEYENGSIDKGLWSQALVKAKGDESLRKVEYMKLRVMQLKQKS